MEPDCIVEKLGFSNFGFQPSKMEVVFLMEDSPFQNQKPRIFENGTLINVLNSLNSSGIMY